MIARPKAVLGGDWKSGDALFAVGSSRHSIPSPLPYFPPIRPW